MTWGIYIWLLALLSGTICHSKQCTLADYYRNIHLFFLKGKTGSELDNFKRQREIFHSLPWKGNFLVEGIPLFLWKLYTPAGADDTEFPAFLCARSAEVRG